MSNIEDYKQSMEIENFLRKVLDIDLGSRDANTLKAFYESLVAHENRHTYMGGSEQHLKRVKKLLKYFEKAIDKLSKRHARIAVSAGDLKREITYIETTQGILSLFHKIRNLMD